MASKTAEQTACTSPETSTPKSPAEVPAKVESAEEVRRRRAGIACFV